MAAGRRVGPRSGAGGRMVSHNCQHGELWGTRRRAKAWSGLRRVSGLLVVP
jgi:hypothetical protein